jgi:hypothetical protein
LVIKKVRNMDKTDFTIGDRVRISSENPDPSLQGRTGKIVSFPIKGKSEYSVQIDVGPLAGRKVWINGFYLKLG